MIFGEFAAVIIDEMGFTIKDLVEFVDKQKTEIPIEMVEEYIEDNELKGLPLYILEDILHNAERYDTEGFFRDCLHD